MRKIVFRLLAGFAGTDAAELEEFSDSVTDEELNEESWQRAIQHAESYGIYPESYLEGLSEQEIQELEDSGEIDNYTDSIEGWWEDYDPEKHDGIL
jgi:hypothetical protein